MRTSGSVLASTNLTLAVALQAFMCARIRLRRLAGGLSRNPTVRRTPSLPQYFVVTTAMRCGVGRKPGITIASRLRCGWFTGLISLAVRAAATQRLRGSRFGKQTIASGGAEVPFDAECFRFAIAAPFLVCRPSTYRSFTEL